MAFFRGEQVQAQRNLELEKRRLRLQNDPSAIFMRELSAGLPRATFQALGNMAVDAAKYNLFGGKERLDLEKRAQGVSEAAERRQQEGQDIEAASILSGEAQRQFAQEKGLDYLTGGQPSKPKQTVKQFEDGTFGLEVPAEQADFSTDDKKTYKRITAEEAKNLQEPKGSGDIYLDRALKDSGYESLSSVGFKKTRDEIAQKAVELKKIDAESAAKEIENYNKNLDSLIGQTAGGALLGDARAQVINNAKIFADGLQERYPGLDLRTSLFQLRNLEKEVLNESKLKNLQRVLRKDSAKVLDVQMGRSNFQTTRDLNQSDKLFLDRLRENQESLQREGALLAEEAERLKDKLNADGSLKEGTPMTPALQEYKKRRNRYIKDQAKLRNDAFKNKRRAERLQLSLASGAFGQEQIRFGSTVMKELGAKADKSAVARRFVSEDKTSFDALYGTMSEERKKQFAASAIGATTEELDALLGETVEGRKVPDTVDGLVDSLFKQDPEKTSSKLATFASKESMELIGGFSKSPKAPTVNENEFDVYFNKPGTLETIVKQRADEEATTVEIAKLYYSQNPDQLINDAKLKFADRNVELTTSQEELTKNANSAITAVNAMTGELPSEIARKAARELNVSVDLISKVRRNESLDANESKALGKAWRNLPKTSFLKGADPIKGQVSQDFLELSKKINFTEDEQKKFKELVKTDPKGAIEMLFIKSEGK